MVERLVLLVEEARCQLCYEARVPKPRENNALKAARSTCGYRFAVAMA